MIQIFTFLASKVRLATLEMSVLLLKQLVYRDVQCFLQDRHLAAIEGAREESTLLLRNFYKVWEKVHMHKTLLSPSVAVWKLILHLLILSCTDFLWMWLQHLAKYAVKPWKFVVV